MADNVSVDEICAILAGEGKEPFTKITITRFVQDGMPKTNRGSYDPILCLRWYVSRLRDSARRREATGENGETLSLDKEQIRLTAAKADNEEMTAAERRASLIPISVYETEMAKIVNLVKTQFLNMPSRIAYRLEGLSRNESKALLTASVKDVLSMLAKGSDDGDTVHASTPAAHAKRTRARVARKAPKRKR